MCSQKCASPRTSLGSLMYPTKPHETSAYTQCNVITNVYVQSRCRLVGRGVANQQHFHVVGELQASVQPFVLLRFDDIFDSPYN